MRIVTAIHQILAKLLEACILETSDGISNTVVHNLDAFRTPVQHTGTFHRKKRGLV